MFKLFLFIGLFSTIFCDTLDLDEINPEFNPLTKSLDQELLSLNQFLPTTPEKCKNTPIILRTLELIMSIMNQNMQRQAHTTYILNLLIKIIEKNTDSFSLKEQEVMSKVLEALENYQGPTLHAASARSQRSPVSKGLSKVQKSYCAEALLKISQIATDAYNKLTNEPLDYEDSNTLSKMFENFALPRDASDEIPLALQKISSYAVNNNEQPSSGVLTYILGQDPNKIKYSNRLKYPSGEIQKTRTTNLQNMAPNKEFQNIQPIYVKPMPARIEYIDLTTEKMSSVNEVPIQSHRRPKKNYYIGKQLGINDIEPTTRRLFMMKEILDIDTHTPKPHKEIKYFQYKYPSSNDSLQIEIVTGYDVGETTESSLPTYLNEPYGNNRVENEEVTTPSSLYVKDFTESPAIVNKNPTFGQPYFIDEITKQKIYYPLDKFENWQPKEFVVPGYYGWELESSTIAPNNFYYENRNYYPQNQHYYELNKQKPDFEYIWSIDHPSNPFDQNNNYENPHQYYIINQKMNPWNHEVQKIPNIVNGVVVDSSENYHTSIEQHGYENKPWALETEVPKETHGNHILWNYDQSQLNNDKNQILVNSFGYNPYSYPLHDNRIVWNHDQSQFNKDNNNNFVKPSLYPDLNEQHGLGYNPTLIPLPHPHEGYISIEDLTGPDNDKFWAHDTLLWNMGDELPEISYDNIPLSELVDVDGVPITLSEQLLFTQEIGPTGDVEFIKAFPENLVNHNANELNDPEIKYPEYFNNNGPIEENTTPANIQVPIPTEKEEVVDSSPELASNDDPQYIDEVTTIKNNVEENHTLSTTTATPHFTDAFLDHDLEYHWPYSQNLSKLDIEVNTKQNIPIHYDINSNPAYNVWSLPNVRPNFIDQNPKHYWHHNQNPVNYWPYYQNPSELEREVITKKNIPVHYDKLYNPAYNVLPLPTSRPSIIDQHAGKYWPYDQNPSEFEIEVTTKLNIPVHYDNHYNPAYNVLPLPTSRPSIIDQNAGFYRPYDQNLDYYRPSNQNPSKLEIEVTTKKYISVDPEIYTNLDYYRPYNQNPSELEIEVTTKLNIPIHYDKHYNPAYNVLPLPTSRPRIIDQNAGFYRPFDQNLDYYRPSNQNPSEFEIEVTTKLNIPFHYDKHYNPAYNVLPLPTSRPKIIDQNAGFYRPYDQNLNYYRPSHQNPSEFEIEVTTKLNIPFHYDKKYNPANNVWPLPTLRPTISDQNPGFYRPYDQNLNYYRPFDQNPSKFEIEITTKKYIPIDQKIYTSPDYYRPNEQYPSELEIEVTTKQYIPFHYEKNYYPANNVWPLPTLRPTISDQNPGFYRPYDQNLDYYRPFGPKPSKFEIEITTKTYISIDQKINTNPDYYRPNEQYPSELEIEVPTKQYIPLHYEKKYNPANNVWPLPTLRPTISDQNPGFYIPYDQNLDYYRPFGPKPSKFEIEITTKKYIPMDQKINTNPDYYRPNEQYPSELEIEVTTKQYIPLHYEKKYNPANNVWPLPTLRPTISDQNPGFYIPYDQNLDYYRPFGPKPSKFEIEITTKKYIPIDQKINTNPDYYRPNGQYPSELEIEVTTKQYIPVHYEKKYNPANNVWPLPTLRPTISGQNPGFYIPYDQNLDYYRPFGPKPSKFEIEITTKKYIPIDQKINTNPDYYRPYEQYPSELEIEVTTKQYIPFHYEKNYYPTNNVWPLPTLRPTISGQNPGFYIPYDQNLDYYRPFGPKPSKFEIEITTKKYIPIDQKNNTNPDYYRPNEQYPSELEIEVTTKQYIPFHYEKSYYPANNVWPLPTLRPTISDQNPGFYIPYDQNLDYYRPFGSKPSKFEIEITTKKYIPIDQKINTNPDYYRPNEQYPSELEIEVTTKQYIPFHYEKNYNPANNVWPLSTLRPTISDQNPGFYRPYDQNLDYYRPFGPKPSKFEIEITTKKYIPIDQKINTNPDFYWPYEQYPSELEIEVTTKQYIPFHYEKNYYPTNNVWPLPTLRPTISDQNPGFYIPYDQNLDYYRPFDQNPSKVEIEVTTKQYIPIHYDKNYNPANNVWPLPTLRPTLIDHTSKYYWPYDQNPNNFWPYHQNPNYYWPFYQNPSELEIEVTTKIYISVDHNIDPHPGYYRPYEQNSGNYWPQNQNPSELEVEVTTKSHISVDHNIDSHPGHYHPYGQNPDHSWPHSQNPTEIEIEVTTKSHISVDHNIDSHPGPYQPYDHNPGHYWPHILNFSEFEIELTTKRHISIDLNIDSHPGHYRPYEQNPGHYWAHNQNPSEIEIEVPTKSYIAVDHNINTHPGHHHPNDQNPGHYWPHNHNTSELEIEVTTKSYISVDHNIHSHPRHYRPHDQKPGPHLLYNPKLGYYWSYHPNPSEFTTKRPVLVEYEIEPRPAADIWVFDENSREVMPYQPGNPILVKDFIQINPNNPWSKPIKFEIQVTTQRPVVPNDQNPLELEFIVTTKPNVLMNDEVGHNPNQINYELDEWKEKWQRTTKIPILNYDHRGDHPNQHWNYDLKRWDLEIEVPKETPSGPLAYETIWEGNPFVKHPESDTNSWNQYIGTKENSFLNRNYNENSYKYYWNQPYEIPNPNQIWIYENSEKSQITTKRPIIHNNRPYIYSHETTTRQPLPVNPVLTDFNYYPWGHNIQMTTSKSVYPNKISTYDNSYPKTADGNSQSELQHNSYPKTDDIKGELGLQHDKWIEELPKKGSITVTNQGPEINIVHKPYIIEDIDDEENINSVDNNIKDSIFLNSDEETEKSEEEMSSNMIPVNEKLISSQDNESPDLDSRTESVNKPSWSFADNGALILTDPIEIPSDDEDASSEILESTDLDIDDNVETETKVIHLIKEKLHEVEKRAKSERDLKILNIINKIRRIISEDVTKVKYLEILTYYDELNNYLKANRNSKLNFIINRLYDLPDQNNLELDSQANVVEMTYLVRRPKPIVIYPYYFIKYKVPVDKIDKLVKENPDLVDNDDYLHVELLKSSEIAEKSPALQNVSERDLLALTVDHGDVINTKLVSTASSMDKKIYFLEDFEDENTIFTREKSNLRSEENKPTNINTLNGDTIHLTIKQNDKPYDTISIENRHYPIEEKNDDQLNDLNDPFRKLFPLYKLKQATDNASTASRQGNNPEATQILEDYYKSLSVQPLPKVDTKQEDNNTTITEEHNSTESININSTPSELDTDKT